MTLPLLIGLPLAYPLGFLTPVWLMSVFVRRMLK